jgi:hypothetical protein
MQAMRRCVHVAMQHAAMTAHFLGHEKCQQWTLHAQIATLLLIVGHYRLRGARCVVVVYVHVV